MVGRTRRRTAGSGGRAYRRIPYRVARGHIMDSAMPANRRDFLRTLASGAGALSTAAAAPKLPNIVYVLADDLGWGDLACYNPDSAIPTPYANRFAAAGMRFTDMHSPSSVCTPTRYGILTGRYCWRSRLKEG